MKKAVIKTSKLGKTVLKIIGGVAFMTMVFINIQVFQGSDDSNISLIYLSNIAGANSENGNGSNDKCPWYVPDSFCNERTESIVVTCTISSQVTRTYYNEHGSVVGQGIVGAGGIVNMTFGYSTGVYTETGGSTGPYNATKVNCPTDGDEYNCTPYFPC